MGSRERDQTTQHQQPHISSLVVRPSGSDGGDGGRGEGGRAAGGSEYEPGEVRRDPPSYSRSDRYKGELGYRTRAGSNSPARRTDGDNRYGSDLGHSGGLPRGREFGSRRQAASGRYRDFSPPYAARGRTGARPLGRSSDGDGPWRGPFRGDGISRNNNPNVRPREGDWYCPDTLCRNLNFARREYCNNCKRHRYAPVGSPPHPRRGYPASPPPPPPLPPPRRFPGPPIDLSPGRSLNGYRSPPRSWSRDGPRDFGHGSGLPPPRHDPVWRDRDRERLHYPDEDYHGGRRPPLDWGHADRGRDPIPKPHYERRPPLSPPPPLLPPLRAGRWGRDIRERSRSPMRGGGEPLIKDYRRDSYGERGRDDRRGGPGRDRMSNAY